MAPKYKRTFSFVNPVTKKRFSCKLQSYQCMATNNRGKECKKKTIISFPYCHLHLLKISKLRVKESLIRFAGLGLFAEDYTKPPNAVVFKPKDIIMCFYGGEQITLAKLNNRYGDRQAPYAITKQDGTIYDAACSRNAFSCVNTNTDSSKINAKFVEKDNYVCLEATKNIKNNAEIYVKYY